MRLQRGMRDGGTWDLMREEDENEAGTSQTRGRAPSDLDANAGRRPEPKARERE
jgi:hypothetical protein